MGDLGAFGASFKSVTVSFLTLLEVCWVVRVGVMLMSVTSVMSPLVSALSPSLVLLIKAGTSILYLTAPGPPSSLLLMG